MRACWKSLTSVTALVALTGFAWPRASAQAPAVVAPIVVDLAAPVIVKVTKPKQPAGTVKFEGFVMNANIAQITLRAKNNETSIQTFPLSQAASEKMQQIVDKGGYQYGDKITVYYDPASTRVIKFTGKPSKPI
jgi:hypothetical protein